MLPVYTIVAESERALRYGRSDLVPGRKLLIASTGWDGLLDRVVATTRSAAPDASVFFEKLLTTDGLVPIEHGIAALTSEARPFVQLVHTVDCEVDTSVCAGTTADPIHIALAVAPSGRPCVVDVVEGATRIGRLRGRTPQARHALVRALERYYDERSTAEAERRQLQDELATCDPDQVRDRIAHLEFLLMHMAPLQVYVGTVLFTNLGKGNLPGRSVDVEAPENLLRRLRAKPVSEWSPEEATFIAVCWVLMSSGPQSRLEEANGMALDLGWLGEMLTLRAQRYGLPLDLRAETRLGTLLEAADIIAARRAALIGEGAVAYRVIHGVNLNKEERLFATAPGVHSLQGLAPRLTQWPTLPASTAAMGQLIAGRVRDVAPRERPDARAEALRSILTDIVEATGADVAMARGPRDPFFVEHPDGREPLELRTNDFYCCVVPSRRFAARHAGQSPPLDVILSAYSARMRFNSWHYLPHVIGRTESIRDDWFFAPTMPDVTAHSEWHHTGHVKFGVRYAIRVPIRAVLGDRDLPGLFDLRLMRATGEPFDESDLEVAVAFGQVLRAFHERTYDSCGEFSVTEFDKAWFRSRYAS